MSWGLGLGARLVSFEMTPDKDAIDLYASSRLRRSPITGVRDALSGYQDGRCAYCDIEFTGIGTSRVAVDHVLPFVLMTRGWQDGDLHQVWNLVLACYGCNSAKRDRPPAAAWMPWLQQRSEYLILSHHPLRETLTSQLGPDRDADRDGRPGLEFSWRGSDEGDDVSGRGWAALNPDGMLGGHFSLHLGDDSAFRAERFNGVIR